MEIKIGKTGRHCVACECDFVHEQEVHSLVRVTEEGFHREDFCAGCWRPELADAAYSAWSLNYYDPEVAEQQPEEAFSPLRRIFYEAVDSENRETLAVAFLAGQLLRRQKVFRLIKETEDPDSDQSVALFNDRIGNRLIEVRDSAFSHAELDTARHSLILRLNELERPPGESNERGEDGESGEDLAEAETRVHAGVEEEES